LACKSLSWVRSTARSCVSLMILTRKWVISLHSINPTSRDS